MLLFLLWFWGWSLRPLNPAFPAFVWNTVSWLVSFLSAVYPRVFSVFSPWYMDHLNDRSLALSSFCFWGAKLCLHRNRLRMLHYDYAQFTGFQEVPELPIRDQFEQVDWFCLSWNEGKSPWVFFCLRRQTYTKGANGTHWKVSLCECVASAVQFKWDTTHCSMISVAFSNFFSLPQISYHGVMLCKTAVLGIQFLQHKFINPFVHYPKLTSSPLNY